MQLGVSVDNQKQNGKQCLIIQLRWLIMSRLNWIYTFAQVLVLVCLAEKVKLNNKLMIFWKER